MRQATVLLLRLFWTLLFVFLLHRALTFDPLLQGSGAEKSAWFVLQAGLVGSLSDVWVAYVCSFAWLLVALFFLRQSVWQKVTAWIWLVFLLLLTALHQLYVEFFHFQFIPAHLPYLYDWEFARANAASLLTWHVIAIVGFGLATFVAFGWVNDWLNPRPTRWMVSQFLLFAICLVAHNRNIHYRVQWFVPETLQTNSIERLYLTKKMLKVPQPLSDEQIVELERIVNVPSLATDAKRLARLTNVVTKTVASDDEMSALGLAIKKHWQLALKAQQKPILQVVLLESMRPAETGFLQKDQVGVTPNLDACASSGISFTRAYSYGTITRGAQEAIFCGYRGSEDTSIMRGRSEVKVSCISDFIKESPNGGDVFWYHGGEGRFDGQRTFWERHAIQHLLSLQDFSENTVKTGWGVGDGVMFKEAAKRLLSLHSRSSKPYLLGMVLSVSNHIPWELPDDAPASIQNLKVSHPSYRTTAYADWALGDYVQALKQNGLWDDQLLIVVSDHGNTVPPYSYSSPLTIEPELKAHINLLLLGGLVEKAMQDAPTDPRRVTRFTVQSDVAAFIAYLLDLQQMRPMGESLLVKERHLPVISDLARSYYLPELAMEMSPNEVLQQPLKKHGPARGAVLYTRAFLELINAWSASTQQP